MGGQREEFSRPEAEKESYIRAECYESFKMKALCLLLLLFNVGCTLHPFLGTRVHSFNHAGIDYIHCSVLMTPDHPQMAEDAIKECQDAFKEHHSLQK